MIKDKIAQRLFGVASILMVCVIGMGVFMFSVNGTSANEKRNNYEFDFPEELTQKDIAKLQTSSNSNGKYGMELSTFLNADDRTMFVVLVWNTQTAKSKIYYGVSGETEMSTAHSDYQLPYSPL